MEPTTYTHQPLSRSLDQIRLIKLRKEREGPVRCEFGFFRLKHAPKYIALSYRWGPSSPLHDILIGDQTLKIRDILNSCLLELREELDTWLWIDQICIAQADTTERNHQVGLMSRIYSTATSVIIWLGDIPLAAPGECDHFNNQNLDDASVMILLGNDYFTRLWVVQEVLLAKRVRFYFNGNRCLEWTTLHDKYSKLVWELEESAPIPIASMFLVSYRRRGLSMGRQMTWTACIDGFSANACADPRDKVYSFMGIVKEEDRFAVDYNKSVLEVYLDLVNILRISIGQAPSEVLRHYLCDLGSQMGVALSLAQSIELPQVRRSDNEAWKAVPANRKTREEQDYWCYEWSGKTFRYPCLPPSSFPSATPAKLQDRMRNVRLYIFVERLRLILSSRSRNRKSRSKSPDTNSSTHSWISSAIKGDQHNV